MIKLIIIYDVVNIFSMKKYKSLRQLSVGVNKYTGVNWSTKTIGEGSWNPAIIGRKVVKHILIKNANFTFKFKYPSSLYKTTYSVIFITKIH